MTCCCVQAQSTNGKARIYAGIGFHRNFFTRSDIHFWNPKTPGYDFTLYKVKAEDDPHLRVGKDYSSPQYTVMVGYLFKNKSTGLELHYDHAKYIVVQNQRVHVSGQINGVPLDKDTTLVKEFLQYEHTHGSNHLMINFIQRASLFQSKDDNHALSAVLKPGAGISIPHTDDMLLGVPGADKYHLSGYVLGIDAGPRYDGFKHFFAELTLKFTYVRYTDVVLGNGGKASQHWFALQPIFMIGFQL